MYKIRSYFFHPNTQKALSTVLGIGVTMGTEYLKGYSNKKGQIAAEQEHKASCSELETAQIPAPSTPKPL